MATPRSETLTRLSDIVFDRGLDVLRGPEVFGTFDLFLDYLDRFDRELNHPLRMQATRPESSALLIKSNRTLSGDGGAKTTPPIDDVVNVYPDTAIDFDGGSVSGSGSVTTEGNSFSLPLVSGVGTYVRMAAVYQSANNRVDTIFSDETAVSGDLTNAGDLFSSLDGLPIGYCDLENVGVSSFKSIASAGDNIENSVLGTPMIYRFSVGGGLGGGALNDFKIKSVNGDVALIGKGFQKLSGDFVLVTGDGTDSASLPLDLNINLTTILGASPVADTTYWLYVDLENVEEPFLLTDNDRPVIRIRTEADFSLLTTAPEDTNPLRFLPVGLIHTADDGSWDGAEALIETTPVLRQTLDNRFFSQLQEAVDTVSSVSGSHSFTHNLEGEPQILEFFYFDGATKVALDESSHLIDKDSETVTYSTLGLSFGGGEFVEAHAFHVLRPGANISLAQSQPEFGWYTDSSVSSVTHNLTDALDIKGLNLLEHDTSTDKYRILDNSNLVLNFDDDTIFFDWSGLSPTPTLRYRLIAGGRALPSSIPIQFGGCTKFVGLGPGNYPTMAAAIADAVAGDSILINKGYTIGSEETISVSDLKIKFMPGVEISVSGGTNGWRITGDRVDIDGFAMSQEFSGTLTNALLIEGDDCSIINTKIRTNDGGATMTNAINGDAASNRNLVQAALRETAGSISTAFVDTGTNNDISHRGP